MERSHSGLVHRSRKPEWVNAHRGFESHPLRHWLKDEGGRIKDENVVGWKYRPSAEHCRIKVEGDGNFILHPSSFILALGEVQEWLNWQHWKCCVWGTVPWVRIPPSPPGYIFDFRLPVFDFCFSSGNRKSKIKIRKSKISLWKTTSSRLKRLGGRLNMEP